MTFDLRHDILKVQTKAKSERKGQMEQNKIDLRIVDKAREHFTENASYKNAFISYLGEVIYGIKAGTIDQAEYLGAPEKSCETCNRYIEAVKERNGRPKEDGSAFLICGGCDHICLSKWEPEEKKSCANCFSGINNRGDAVAPCNRCQDLSLWLLQVDTQDTAGPK